MRQPILQQYYTRAREGVFRSNEGYDTVAKSAALENSLIKKTLHPFCAYDVPRELQERGEKDLSLYPPAFLTFFSETGEMIMGQSVYVGADFTGQRNTFFSHYYVIPHDRQEEYWRHPERITGATGFVSSYDPALGKELPALHETPYVSLLAAQSAKRVLQELGITELAFKQLLAAVMIAVSGKKKVFVVPPVAISEHTEWARKLLAVIYRGLPYAQRRRFGFLTYAGEAQSRKHVHLVFVPHGSLRGTDSAIDKEFQFDFAEARFQNLDLIGNIDALLYLDFVWEQLDRPDELERYQQFAEEILAGADQVKSLNPLSYQELCGIYLTERGREMPYRAHKTTIQSLIVQYLADQTLRNKERLHSLFMGLFREEQTLQQQGGLPEIEGLRVIIDYASLIKEEREIKELLLYILNAMLRAKERGQLALIDGVYQHIQRDVKLFRRMMLVIMQNQQLVHPLFLDIVVLRFVQANHMDELLQALSFWFLKIPATREHTAFLRTAAEAIQETSKREADLVSCVKRVRAFVKEHGLAEQRAQYVTDAADLGILHTLNLGQLSASELAILGEFYSEKPEVFANELNRTCQDNFNLLVKLHALLEGTVSDEAPRYYANMESGQIDQLEDALRRVMAEEGLSEQHFRLLPYAFYQEQDFTDSGAAIEAVETNYRYDRMLIYVTDQLGKAGLPAFVRWSVRQEAFLAGIRLHPAYRHALKQYLLRRDREALRKKASRQAWYAIKQSDLRHMLDEVKKETANGLVRFLRKPVGKVVAALLVLGLLGAGAGYYFLQQQQQPVKVEQPVQVPAKPPVYGPSLPQKQTPAGQEIPDADGSVTSGSGTPAGSRTGSPVVPETGTGITNEPGADTTRPEINATDTAGQTPPSTGAPVEQSP